MFNRTFVLPAPRTQTIYETTRVVEQRAPTDDSIKIFREMVDAARREVVASVKVADTEFEFVVHAAQDFASGDVVLAAIFSLGGCKTRVESRTRAAATPEERCEKLIEDVSRRIAEQAVRPALAALLRERVPA